MFGSHGRNTDHIKIPERKTERGEEIKLEFTPGELAHRRQDSSQIPVINKA